MRLRMAGDVVNCVKSFELYAILFWPANNELPQRVKLDPRKKQKRTEDECQAVRQETGRNLATASILLRTPWVQESKVSANHSAVVE